MVCEPRPSWVTYSPKVLEGKGAQERPDPDTLF